MQRASRIFSILLGIAITFLLWPVAVPLGFGEVWWASQKAQSQSDAKPVPSEAPPEVVPPPPAPPPQAASPLPAPAPAPEQQAVEPSSSSSEPVEPSNTAKPEQSAALEDKNEPAPTVPTVTKLYYRITVRDGRTLQSGGVVIRLSGLAARDADATCKSAKGKTWPCGAEAKAALTRLIRTRAVSCEVPKGKEQKEIVARCSLAGADLSTWMVRQGWAEPQDANEPALAEAAKAAKQDKLGLWRGAE
jgi:endonuclease YncB( thermonuclease family)